MRRTTSDLTRADDYAAMRRDNPMSSGDRPPMKNSLGTNGSRVAIAFPGLRAAGATVAALAGGTGGELESIATRSRQGCPRNPHTGLLSRAASGRVQTNVVNGAVADSPRLRDKLLRFSARGETR